ncbi:MAG: CcoQ/FixQ family Cbb3-type cytochrome c oxidase assembly chaperone [Gammaproteobacteria bacterium]|nr:CcoQ/FixQ family Cbb3-type cytochrome c oxidase assembly chaperone [Gammaproteobacteria bacterium]
MQSTQELFGALSGIFTAVLIVLLTAITAWAWSARRRDAFDAAARVPLEEDPGIRRDDDQERVP